MKNILRRTITVLVTTYFRLEGQQRTALYVSERSRLFPFFRWLYGFAPMVSRTSMQIFGYERQAPSDADLKSNSVRLRTHPDF